MPFIVNQTFFVGELAIPNLSHQADLEKLNFCIAKYEPDCLLRILGYPLYKAFGDEDSQRMTDLLDGAEYYDGEGNLRHWVGLKHDTNQSLIAAYVFFYYQQNYATHNTGVNTAVQEAEAGHAVSPRDKMSNAWNWFSRETFEMTHFLWMRRDDALVTKEYLSADERTLIVAANTIGTVRTYPEFTYHQFLETRRISRKIDSVFSL